MPELPEVEFARRSLLRWLSGRKVVRAEAEPSRIFRGADRAAFLRLRGRLVRAERKGKYLLLTFEKDQGLLSHLGMTGKWVRRAEGLAEPYSRARLVLDDGHSLHSRDPRMFGRLEPVPATTLWSLPPIAALGPDPLNDPLTPKLLKQSLSKTRQPLKVALMDQARLAGLGNIHAAEALFRAKLHPKRKPQTLSDPEWARLHRAILATLEHGLEGDDVEEISYVEEPGSENPFLIYGREGQGCGRCGTRVKAFAQAGRTTHFCPGCQPLRGKR